MCVYEWITIVFFSWRSNLSLSLSSYDKISIPNWQNRNAGHFSIIYVFVWVAQQLDRAEVANHGRPSRRKCMQTPPSPPHVSSALLVRSTSVNVWHFLNYNACCVQQATKYENIITIFILSIYVCMNPGTYNIFLLVFSFFFLFILLHAQIFVQSILLLMRTRMRWRNRSHSNLTWISRMT